jgi:hypothetical protein
MRVLPKLSLLSLLKGEGAARFPRLVLVAALFWVASCKKPAPAPVVKIISPDAIHVTAISLGQPKLAIVNGKQLGEGDELVASATRLRLVKISDGEIELSSGAQVILARLAPPKPSAPRR